VSARIGASVGGSRTGAGAGGAVTVAVPGFFLKILSPLFASQGGRERGERSPKSGERHPDDDVSTTSPPTRCTTFTLFYINIMVG